MLFIFGWRAVWIAPSGCWKLGQSTWHDSSFPDPIYRGLVLVDSARDKWIKAASLCLECTSREDSARCSGGSSDFWKGGCSTMKMSFQRGVPLLILVFKGGGGVPLSNCVILTLFWQKILTPSPLWIRQWRCGWVDSAVLMSRSEMFHLYFIGDFILPLPVMGCKI
jgi:hypothetical protein